ncbi:hypothetical protein ACFLV0_07255 [Chloroflexota bacterium]
MEGKERQFCRSYLRHARDVASYYLLNLMERGEGQGNTAMTVSLLEGENVTVNGEINERILSL